MFNGRKRKNGKLSKTDIPCLMRWNLHFICFLHKKVYYKYRRSLFLSPNQSSVMYFIFLEYYRYFP